MLKLTLSFQLRLLLTPQVRLIRDGPANASRKYFIHECFKTASCLSTKFIGDFMD